MNLPLFPTETLKLSNLARRTRIKSTDLTSVNLPQRDYHRKLHLREFDYGKLRTPKWFRGSEGREEENEKEKEKGYGLSGCTTARESVGGGTGEGGVSWRERSNSVAGQELWKVKLADVLGEIKVGRGQEKPVGKNEEKSYEQHANYNKNPTSTNNNNVLRLQINRLNKPKSKEDIVKPSHKSKEKQNLFFPSSTTITTSPDESIQPSHLSSRLSLNVNPKKHLHKVQSTIRTTLEDKAVITQIVNRYQNTKIKVLRS